MEKSFSEVVGDGEKTSGVDHRKDERTPDPTRLEMEYRQHIHASDYRAEREGDRGVTKMDEARERRSYHRSESDNQTFPTTPLRHHRSRYRTAPEAWQHPQPTDRNTALLGVCSESVGCLANPPVRCSQGHAPFRTLRSPHFPKGKDCQVQRNFLHPRPNRLTSDELDTRASRQYGTFHLPAERTNHSSAWVPHADLSEAPEQTDKDDCGDSPLSPSATSSVEHPPGWGSAPRHDGTHTNRDLPRLHSPCGREDSELLSGQSSVRQPAGGSTPQSGQVLEAKHITNALPPRNQSHASPQEVASLPLHTKEVNKGTLYERYHQMKRLDKLAPGAVPLAVFFLAVIKSIEDNSSEILTPDGPLTKLTMELSPGDITELLDRGLIRAVAHSPDRPSNVRVFSVVERAKGRRRWISHTPSANDITEISETSSMKREKLSIIGDLFTRAGCFPKEALAKTAAEVLCQASEPFGFTVDFASYFNQFSLDPQHRLWRFSAYHKEYELLTIPTGAGFCPALAQLMSYSIARAVHFRFPLCNFDVYADNIRFTAKDSAYLQAVATHFYQLCADIGITINEDIDTILRMAPEYDYLGVHFDHAAGTTALSEKMINKVKATNLHCSTLREFLAIYGLFNYCSGILRMSRAPFYYATKFLRRQVGRPLDCPCTIWPSAMTALSTWKLIIIQHPPLTHRPLAPQCLPAHLFTDSSTAGFGAVLMTALGRTEIIAGRWSDFEHNHINVKESMAVYIALTRLRLTATDVSEIHLHIDNTSTLFACIKGASKNFMINQIIARCWQLPIWKKVVSIKYVASEDNKADTPSRLMTNLHVESDNPFAMASFTRLHDQAPYAGPMEVSPVHRR